MTSQKSEKKKLEWKTTLHVQVNLLLHEHWWSSSIQWITYDPYDLYELMGGMHKLLV